MSSRKLVTVDDLDGNKIKGKGTHKKLNRQLKNGFNRMTNGNWVTSPLFIQLFGCKTCAWQATSICPHGIKSGKTHSHHICSFRSKYLEEKWNDCKSGVKLIQSEELLKSVLIEDKLLQEFITGGELHPDLHKIQRNIISLTGKMRKQDEGIKFQGEITVAHENLRKMVEVEAKKIQERNNRTRPAEFTEEVQSS